MTARCAFKIEDPSRAPGGSILEPRTKDLASRGPRHLRSRGTLPPKKETLHVVRRCTKNLASLTFAQTRYSGVPHTRFPFWGEGSLWILGLGVHSRPNPSSGAVKLTLPGPREGSSILNAHLVVMSAAVIKIIIFIWFLADFRPNLAPRPTPTGRAQKMEQNAPEINPGDQF